MNIIGEGSYRINNDAIEKNKKVAVKVFKNYFESVKIFKK